MLVVKAEEAGGDEKMRDFESPRGLFAMSRAHRPTGHLTVNGISPHLHTFSPEPSVHSAADIRATHWISPLPEGAQLVRRDFRFPELRVCGPSAFAPVSSVL